MIDDWIFYLFAIPAVFITAVSKGGFGGGLGMLAVPLMAMVISPVQAAAIMLPVLCLMDLVSIWGFRRRFSREHLKVLLPAALAGIFLGAMTFDQLSEGHLKLIIGSVALAFCLIWLVEKISHKPVSMKMGNGYFWGGLAGFCSFSVHAGGPPLNIYLLPKRLDKGIYVGTTILFFTVVNYVKLIPYAWLGLLQPGNLKTSLFLMIFAPIGVYTGMYLHKRINDSVFYLCCYVLLGLAGTKLFYEGVMSFIG